MWQTCAEQGFFRMGKCALLRLCEAKGVDIRSGSSLFDVVYHLCRACFPGLSVDQVMQICHKRLVTPMDDENYTRELLSIDEAIEVMDVHDHKAIRNTQKTAQLEAFDREVYVRDYKNSKREQRAAVALEQPKRRKKKHSPSIFKK